MSLNDTLTRETIKETVEKFFSEHNEKELLVSIFLDKEFKKTICNFHMNPEYLQIDEDSTKSELIIADYTTSKSLIPDEVTISYEEVVNCEVTIQTGETEDDILADVLEVTFRNGIILEFGFLYI